MERQARDFYVAAAGRSTDVDTRTLLGELAAAEAGHEAKAQALTAEKLDGETRSEEDLAAKRQFVLTWVQPGLAGLMDGSVSTLAPIFATAFATQDPRTTFLIGLSASVGAGISMGFTEAAHDDGKLSGRGAPWKRGLASGVMTALGGLGHALPYLIPHFWTATTIALMVVFIELWAIVWIHQNRYMETPFLRAAFQIVLGGGLVLAAGILIGAPQAEEVPGAPSLRQAGLTQSFGVVLPVFGVVGKAAARGQRPIEKSGVSFRYAAAAAFASCSRPSCPRSRGEPAVTHVSERTAFALASPPPPLSWRRAR